MLHIIQSSPFNNLGFNNCIQHAKSGDAIIFIEDGVLAVIKNTKYARIISKQEEIEFYALAVDLAARGIEEQSIPLIQLIDYQQFVELAIQHHPIITWN